MALALFYLGFAEACSSTSTTEAATGGAAGGGACADAGLGCVDCCKASVGELKLAGFVGAVKTCSCTDITEGCVGKCKPVCSSGAVVDDCMLCIRAGEMSTCMSQNCTSDDCQSFFACVNACGG